MRDSAVSIDQLDAPFRGILFIVAGISIFSIQDVVIKWISGDYSVHQILFVRSLVALLPAEIARPEPALRATLKTMI